MPLYAPSIQSPASGAEYIGDLDGTTSITLQVKNLGDYTVSEHPYKSFTAFPYYFSEYPAGVPSGGIRFGGPIPTPPPTPTEWLYDYDLAIYYNTLTGNDFIDCRCSRWDVQNYQFIIETWLKRNDLLTLLTYLKPGATGELFTVLGRPRFYDKTWSKGNTLRFYPTPSSSEMGNSKLYKMRRETLGFVKNISTHPIKSTDWIQTKFECYISGVGDL